MELFNSNSEISLLFIGRLDFYEEIRKKAPKTWKVTHKDSIKNFLNSPLEVNVILDASIREVIDLNLKEFSTVKYIACASTGTNHIKLNQNNLYDQNIFSLRDIPDFLSGLTSAAEFTFGILIAMAKQIIPAANSTKSEIWDRTKFPGAILKGKKLGLIGFGRIGQTMGSFAKGFNMEVAFYDPYIDNKPKKVLEYKSVESLVENSDFISVHIPYSPATHSTPFITSKIFSSFKPGSYFINTSRGEVIDETGLIAAMESGRIVGAALDVLVGEPEIANNVVYKYAKSSGANIIFTPHIAGYSIENLKSATTEMLLHLIDQIEST